MSAASYFKFRLGSTGCFNSNHRYYGNGMMKLKQTISRVIYLTVLVSENLKLVSLLVRIIIIKIKI